MADTAISTNNKISDDLSLTGKPVLVQNHLGIFYGFLEKSDSRSGSALLRDAFKLSPDRHITFSQYLDFLSNEIDNRYDHASDTLLSEAREDAENAGDNPDEIGLPEILNEYSLVPNEITISQGAFDEHRKDLSITEYASEGIYLVQHRTSTHENSRYTQSTAPLMSLTSISAIVAISESPVEHAGLEYIAEDISRDGWLDKEDVSLYYDVVPPIVSFGLISDRSLIEISQILFNIDKVEGLDVETSQKARDAIKPIFDSMKSKSADYILDIISRQVKEYINEDLIKDDKSLRRFILEYLTAIQKMPALVVNSDRRSAMYKKLKKAQDNEQDK